MDTPQIIDETKKKPGRPAKELPLVIESSEKKSGAITFDDLKEMGIPIAMAVFHRAIKSWTGEPETAFYTSKAKPSRTAQMWYTPHGLAWEQAKGARGIVPLANVSDTRLL